MEKEWRKELKDKRWRKGDTDGREMGERADGRESRSRRRARRREAEKKLLNYLAKRRKELEEERATVMAIIEKAKIRKNSPRTNSLEVTSPTRKNARVATISGEESGGPKYTVYTEKRKIEGTMEMKGGQVFCGLGEKEGQRRRGR